MKRLLLMLMSALSGLAADFSLLTINSDLTLPTWATNFFTANAGYIPASGAATRIATNAGTGWGTTLISPYSSGGTNSTPAILQPTLYDDITLAELTASRVLTTDGSKILSASSVTTTELGYLSGVTSALQTQLAAKAPLVSPSFTTPSLGSATATTIAFTDAAVTVAANSTNGSSGFLFNITGASGALMRFRTNTTTVHTFLANGNYFPAGSIELGNASDTTLARSAAGVVTIEGVTVAERPTTTALTYSGTNVTLTATSHVLHGNTLTLTNNCLLTITSSDGASGGITIVPHSSTSYTVYLDSAIKLLGGGSSFVVTNSASETVNLEWKKTLRGGSSVILANKVVYP